MKPQKQVLRSTWSEKLKLLLLPSKLYSRYLLWKHQRRGDKELNLLPFLIDPEKDAIDIGANKGVYTRALARLVPLVHAFEPNPKIYRILSAGCPINASTYPIALSDVSRTNQLLIPFNPKRKTYSNQGASLSRVKVSGQHAEIEVTSQTLDSYQFSNVGFIKIDVEGHELAVLTGAKKTLAEHKPTLMIELEERHTGFEIRELIDQVEQYGYSGYFLRNGVLTNCSKLDALGEHREALKTEKYVFNFIFFPLKQTKLHK